MNEEIEAVQKPQIVLSWNGELLAVEVAVNGLRNLDMALMMLEGAKVQLGFQRNLIAAQQLEAQRAEIQQAQHVANQVRRNGIIR